MALSGKLIGHVEISKKGDIFHDLLRYDFELHDGERGAVGSVISWHYTHEGKKKASKQIMEAVDEENQTMKLKVIGGDLVEELYKSFTITFHVEEKGDKQVATWTLEFEKPDINVPYPTSFMDFLCDSAKDMDAHTSTTNEVVSTST